MLQCKNMLTFSLQDELVFQSELPDTLFMNPRSRLYNSPSLLISYLNFLFIKSTLLQHRLRQTTQLWRKMSERSITIKSSVKGRKLSRTFVRKNIIRKSTNPMVETCSISVTDVMIRMDDANTIKLILSNPEDAAIIKLRSNIRDSTLDKISRNQLTNVDT